MELSFWYKERLLSFSSPSFDVPYGFDYMSGGEYVSPTLRRAYAAVLESMPEGHDPFDSNGVVAAFAKKNYLFDSSGGYRPIGLLDINKHKNKLKVANVIMRLILRFWGANNFMHFSRLLVFLSSYRLNKDLWKV